MNNYHRNPKKIKDNLVVTKNRQVVCKEECSVLVPTRFKEIGLCNIDEKVSVLGSFIITMKDKSDKVHYGVVNVNTMIELGDSEIEVIKDDEGSEFYSFNFSNKDIVFNNTDLLKNDLLIFEILNEFIFKGKVPWYMEYEDMGNLFSTAEEYSGSKINNNEETIELLISIISRLKKNRVTNIRNSVTSYEEITKDTICYVPLSSVFFSVNSTFNKLAGNNFHEGVTSALVKTTDEASKVETLLRI